MKYQFVLLFIFLAACTPRSLELEQVEPPFVRSYPSLSIRGPFMYLHLNQDHSYLMVTREHVLHISSSGDLLHWFVIPAMDTYSEARVHQDLLYISRSNNDFSDFNQESPISTTVYTARGEMVDEFTWKNSGLIYSLEMDALGRFAVLAYQPHISTMSLLHVDAQGKLFGSLILSKAGTTPSLLAISSDQHFICAEKDNSGFLYSITPDFGFQWATSAETSGLSQVVDGGPRGIYVGGGWLGEPNTISLFSNEGMLLGKEQITSSSSLAAIGSYSLVYLSVGPEKLFTFQSAENSSLVRINCFTDALGELSTSEIAGTFPFSNPVPNELGGFSFVYSMPDTTDATGKSAIPRLFKLGPDCLVPE